MASLEDDIAPAKNTSSTGIYNTTALAVLTTMYISIIAASLVGNLLICFAIIKNKALLRSPCNYFILSLALSDVGTTVFAMPFDLEQLILEGRWTHSELLCDIWTTVYLITVPTSILNLLALSIDRYKTLKDPLNRYKQSPFLTVKRVLLAIAALWIYSLVFALIPKMGWKQFPTSKMDNICNFNISPIYGALSSALNFVLPMLVMCWIYSRIYKIANERPKLCSQSSYGAVSLQDHSEDAAKRPRSYSAFSHTQNCYNKGIDTPRRASCFEVRAKGTVGKDRLGLASCKVKYSISSTEMRASEQSPSTSPLLNHDGKRLSGTETRAKLGRLDEEVFTMINGASSQQSHRNCRIKNFIRNTRAARTISLIVCSFFCCWMPHTVLSFATTFCKLCSLALPEEVPSFLLMLGYLSSALNPYLYSCQDSHFRQEYRQLLRSLCPCAHRKKARTSLLRHFLAEASSYSINIVASAGNGGRRSIVMLNAVRRLSRY